MRVHGLNKIFVSRQASHISRNLQSLFMKKKGAISLQNPKIPGGEPTKLPMFTHHVRVYDNTTMFIRDINAQLELNDMRSFLSI